MSTINKYHFEEANLDEKFCHDRISDIKKLLGSGDSFCIHVTPGTGLSQFLRFLATRNFAKFIYIDVAALAELNKSALIKLILSELGGNPERKSDQKVLEECKEKLAKLCLADKKQHVVLIINRFDHLRNEFGVSLFSNLLHLKTCGPNFAIICTSVRPIADLAPETLDAASLNLFARSYFFIPYPNSDLIMLFKTLHPHSPLPEKFEQMVKTSGGNYQLLELLTKTEIKNNPLEDTFIRMHMQRITSFLSSKEINLLTKLALKKPVREIPNFLTNVGLVKKMGGKYSLFSPLYAEFLKSRVGSFLPFKERKLFQILKKNLGQTVPKETLFQEIWGDKWDEASDWALNSLVYRLRSHPAVKSEGYSIENQKKLGYSLVKD